MASDSPKANTLDLARSEGAGTIGSKEGSAVGTQDFSPEKAAVMEIDD